MHPCSTHARPAPPAGPLTEQPLAEFHRLLAAVGAAHFVFAKTVLPALRPTPASSFLFVSEGAGKRMVGGPETSLYSVAASTVYGIILAAQARPAAALGCRNARRPGGALVLAALVVCALHGSSACTV